MLYQEGEGALEFTLNGAAEVSTKPASQYARIKAWNETEDAVPVVCFTIARPGDYHFRAEWSASNSQHRADIRLALFPRLFALQAEHMPRPTERPVPVAEEEPPEPQSPAKGEPVLLWGGIAFLCAGIAICVTVGLRWGV